MFLMGPLKQLKRMADPTRIVCTIILIVSFLLKIFLVPVISHSLWLKGFLVSVAWKIVSDIYNYIAQLYKGV